MKINLFYDDIKYRIKNRQKIKKLVIKVIRNEKKIPGDLNFIFTGDDSIRKINKEFLKRDNFTDVIAFDYCEGNLINGEIYISVDTVKDNATNYKVSLECEIVRVVVHGTLHLCGYKDKEVEERNKMRLMEDKWINDYYGTGKNGIQI